MNFHTLCSLYLQTISSCLQYHFRWKVLLDIELLSEIVISTVVITSFVTDVVGPDLGARIRSALLTCLQEDDLVWAVTGEKYRVGNNSPVPKLLAGSLQRICWAYVSVRELKSVQGLEMLDSGSSSHACWAIRMGIHCPTPGWET